MSLSELFEASIDDADSATDENSPWSFSLQYKMVEFKGYLEGSEHVGFHKVLWDGPTETRTNENFPVVPTVITQKAHIATVGYEFNDSWRAHLSIPHVEQNTDHISSVANYDQFSIETSGLGDVVISASNKFHDTLNSNWWFTLGLSLPTGSINEKGDTPRSPGDQQLPYTMQLGSGTYDFPISVNYQLRGDHDINIGFSAMLRSGENDRDYRLGNSYALKGRYNFHFFESVHPFLGLDYQYSEAIHGEDKSIIVEAAFPYPASITNPDLYGGKKLDLRAGVYWQFARHYRLVAEVGKPLYQHLNGPQPEEDWRSSLKLSRTL